MDAALSDSQGKGHCACHSLLENSSKQIIGMCEPSSTFSRQWLHRSHTGQWMLWKSVDMRVPCKQPANEICYFSALQPHIGCLPKLRCHYSIPGWGSEMFLIVGHDPVFNRSGLTKFPGWDSLFWCVLCDRNSAQSCVPQFRRDVVNMSFLIKRPSRSSQYFFPPQAALEDIEQNQFGWLLSGWQFHNQWPERSNFSVSMIPQLAPIHHLKTTKIDDPSRACQESILRIPPSHPASPANHGMARFLKFNREGTTSLAPATSRSPNLEGARTKGDCVVLSVLVFASDQEGKIFIRSFQYAIDFILGRGWPVILPLLPSILIGNKERATSSTPSRSCSS